MDNKKNVNILGVNFYNTTLKDLIHELTSKLVNKEKLFLITANPEIVMYALKDQSYMEVVQQADYVTADGIGVVKAASMLNTPLPERVAGYDILTSLLDIAERENLKVYFLGAKPEIVSKAVDKTKQKHPGINIVGFQHGYTDVNDEKLINSIVEKEPDIVFVALGFPKQETWIKENMGRFKHGLFMGVGGSFDVLSGEMKRAPLVWQKFHIEWLYRLLKQPTRWKRMLVLPQFLVEVKKSKK